MTLKNTTVRLEFVPEPTVGRGLALEIKAATVMFAGGDDDDEDEAGRRSMNPPGDAYPGEQPSGRPRRYSRRLFLEGVTFHSDDFTFRPGGGGGDDNSMLDSMIRRSRAFSGGSSVGADTSSKEGEEEEEEEEQESEEDKREEAEEEEETQPPLQWGALTGKQELIVRFSDTNQFGLPRSLDEVELNLGGLLVHLFPHQIHALTEVIGALTVSSSSPASPSAAAAAPAANPQQQLQLERRRLEEQRNLNLESALVQRSILLQHQGGGGVGWDGGEKRGGWG